MLRALAAASIVAVVRVLCADRAAAQIPPETSLYELVEIVPPPAPATCGCTAGAFALPTFRPGPGNGWRSGPGAPLDNAPLPEALHPRAAERFTEERERLPRNAEDGLAGNENATLAVAMHLRESSLAVGVDARTEEEAARWIYLAAEQGHRDAFMFLGYRYQRGDGVPQSDETAAYWFHQGAIRGDKNSMLALGLRYASGRGVPQDYGAAVYWLRQAGTPLASRFLGDAYACGLGVDLDSRLAVREYAKAAKAGEVSANIQLGRIYMSGCTAANDKAAANALRSAADQGFPEAQIMLSQLLLQGRGVEANPSEAYYWARLAERRLGAGELRTMASERVKTAARMIPPEAIAAGEANVEAMITASGKSRQ